VLSIATGHDVGYLTGAVGGGREGYYTGAVAAGEPPGVWYGAGAELLGLRGVVDAEQMEAVYHQLLDPRDPASGSRATWGEAALLGTTHKNYRSAQDIYAASLKAEPHAGPERRAELRAQADRAERQPVAFLDATFSAPKSVSVLGVAFERAATEARTAGDHRAADAYDAHARAVEEAVLAGARAALQYLQDRAGYARVGHHGGQAGQWIDAHHFVVAQFLQHDSRDRDPQLHVHQAILNRVLCADGLWRALDSRAIHTWRAAAAAVGERVMEAYLTRALGVRFETRPDGKAREVIGVRAEIRELFSSRRHVIGPAAQRLITAFRERYDRDPSALERTRLAQQATLATRKAKSHDGETLGQRLDRWSTQAHAAMRGGLAEVARHVLDLAQQVEPAAAWSPRDVIERAVAAVAQTKKSWSRSDLTRHISDALPGHVGLDPERIPQLLDGLTDEALAEVVATKPEEPTEHLPPEVLLADGRSPYCQPGGARYATSGQLAADHAMRAAAVRRGAAQLTDADPAAVIAQFAESGVELSADQAAAVRGVLTSGAQVETLLAAAGTGKSFTVAALAGAWTQGGRRVFGLAPSQVATEVLTEDGVTARNIARWLGTQDRLDHATPGTPAPGGSDPDEEWRLRGGDLVVVDEAGMADTGDLSAIQRRCAAAGAKLLLVGDPRQLAAVGPGGTLGDLAERGITYQLAEVHRFRQAWERTESLRLRDGDPAAVEAYARHGRLVAGGTAEQAEAKAARGWLADTLAGRSSLLLVGSNEAAARLSAAVRADLVALGRVEETGVELGRQDTVAGVGDLVQARRNGWDLIGYAGNTRAPINRETYRVTGLRGDGGVTVAPVRGRHPDHGAELLGEPLHLPASYVTEDLTLGYASTVHAAQGRTTDTAHAVLGPGSDTAGAYVAMTRGRDRNTAYAVTTLVAADAPTGTVHDVAERSAAAVLADILARDPHNAGPGDVSALGEQEQEAQAARSTQRSLERLAAEVARLTAGRTGVLLDRLAAEDMLNGAQRQAVAADEAYPALERLLRTVEVAGHDPERVLRDAVTGRGLDGARFPAQVLHHRITDQLAGQLTPRLSSYADLLPRGLPEQWHTLLTARAEAADQRRRELGAHTAETAPQWAVEALGAVPEDPVARAQWEHKAGWAAAHRELIGHTSDTDPLGKAPPAGQAERHAVWRAAHDALALPDTVGDEHELSDGQLRMRVRAFDREQTWAPRWVGDELDATHQHAAQARADAQIWAARAHTIEDGTERDRLLTDAAAAETKAAELDERAAQLELADEARGAWYAATAVTRDVAARARGALEARGIDPDDPDERVTADEWLAAHRAEQLAEDPHREIHHEAELNDTTITRDATLTDANDAAAARDDAARFAAAVPSSEPTPADKRETRDRAAEVDTDRAGSGVETGVLDIRDLSQPDATEHDDVARRRDVPTAADTAAAVARAQAALAEIETRRAADAQREAREAAAAEQINRREELTRWAEQDQAAEHPDHTHDGRDDDDALVGER